VERALTIAAGFSYLNGGVLLCADSELTEGDAKYSGQKIFPITFGGPQNPGPKIAFAIAGWVPHTKRAISMCKERLREAFHTNHKQLTNEGIRECIESGLDEFHRKYIFSHPFYGTDRGPSIAFVIGCWSAVTGRPSLFVTSENVVNEVHGYDCIGIGSYFARYTCSNLYAYNLPPKKIVLLAAHVLRQTKNNVPSCGKESQFLTIEVGGKMEYIAAFEITAAEVLSEKFTHLLQSLYLDIVDIDEDFAGTMKAFENAAVAVRAHTNIAIQNNLGIMRFLSFNAQRVTQERKDKKEKGKGGATSSSNEPAQPPEQSGGAAPKKGARRG
jgi:20S proteasome alpha/beta subunit